MTADLSRTLTEAELRLAKLSKHAVRDVAVARMERAAGSQQFGCSGRHHGRGTPDCPRELHHHHDEFCDRPLGLEATWEVSDD